VNASTTRSLPPDRQFDRYMATMCSLMLMVVLAVGATGYAGIQGLSSSTTAAAKAAPVDQSNRAARPERLVTPAAIALALIAAFLVVVADRTSSSRSYPIKSE
jgi:hypothetical protein